jgi:hypothetical protein
MAHQPFLQQEITVHRLSNYFGNFIIKKFYKGVAAGSSRFGGAGNTASIDGTELV